MTNVPTLGFVILYLIILSIAPFMTAFIIYYMKFPNPKRATLIGILSIGIFSVLHFINQDSAIGTIAVGILAAAIGILAYPPPSD